MSPADVNFLDNDGNVSWKEEAIPYWIQPFRTAFLILEEAYDRLSRTQLRKVVRRCMYMLAAV